jgi:ectoine hydroxylase-related dioxygenase (phytanoyl-CoA dioxygenase family)
MAPADHSRDQRSGVSWGPWSTKAGIPYAHAPATALERIIALRVLLDDSRPDNGPLRVLPGTHRLGDLSDAEVADLSTRVQPVECLAPSGGVVAMRSLLVHVSTKSRSAAPRRVLHIEYAATAELDDGCVLAIV